MSERYKAKYVFNSDYGAVNLTCHFKFERATEAQKFNPAFGGGRTICNGCGPSGFGALIPDTIFGVCVTICGHIHNWGYQFGIDREDKNVVDETFGDNMDRLIRAAYEWETWKIRGGSFVKPRLWMAKQKYYARIEMAERVYEKAVRVFGKSAFWDKRIIAFCIDDVV